MKDNNNNFKHAHHQDAARKTGIERKIQLPPDLVAALDEAVAYESPSKGHTP